MVPITGRAGTFLEFSKLQSQSKLNPNQVQSIFFALLYSSVSKANLSCVVATIFPSLAFFFRPSPRTTCRLVATIFSSLAFISSSVYMAKLSRLIAASFSSPAHLFFFSLHGQPQVFVSDLSLSSHFHHLASIFESDQALFLVVLCF